jgi:tRNA modification GTPase
MASWDTERTIVAVSSPLAPGQRAVVRVSGALTRQLLNHLLIGRESLTGISDARIADSAALARFLDSNQNVYCHCAMDLSWHGRWIDCGVYYWPNQRSFTGESACELHFIGSLPLARRIVQCLIGYGAHPAERGEFALRSFLAGKMDLLQAEGLLGVIESTGSTQLEWSLSQMGGNLSKPVVELRKELISLLVDLEAGLDFVEEDIEFITDEELRVRLEQLSQRIGELTRQLDSRGVNNRSIEVAVAGLPNAGKSSLFNLLLGKDRAIVSPQSGTTRDSVTADARFEGLESAGVTLVDTAGIEQIDSATARGIAQELLPQRLKDCDIIIWCVDINQPLDSFDWQKIWRQRIGDTTVWITVGTKGDLASTPRTDQHYDAVVSVHWPESIKELRHLLQSCIQTLTDQRFTEATHQTAVRCRAALSRAKGSLSMAQRMLADAAGHELVASELRCALDDLSSIIGEVHSDDILGEIFGRFCIGK